MTHPLHTRPLILGIALTTTVACTTPNETCDPMQDERCVCDDPYNADTCRIDDTNNTSEINNGTNEVTNNYTNNVTNNALPPYRYLMLEDLSSDNLNGDTPGADIDAIAIEKDGVEYYAAVVEDFNFGGTNNGYTDPSELLGAPDSGCTKANFTALGGAVNDGYVMVSFEDDAIIESGDLVVIYELGPTVCPSQPNWLDDGYNILISTSTDREHFELISTDPGQGVFEVP